MKIKNVILRRSGENETSMIEVPNGFFDNKSHVYSTFEITQQSITDLELTTIEQGQQMTDLELMILEGYDV